MKLCDSDKCTGCGLCKVVCQNNAISFVSDDVEVVYPNVDATKCVDCGLCVRYCPALNQQKGNHIQHVYAAWSCNNEVRRTSASGGIATELYNYALRHGWAAYGVAYQPERGAVFVKITADNLDDVRNSKYTFSSDSIPYESIADAMKNGPVLFVGLPCQVSAVKAFISSKKLNESTLYTADLICHGVPPFAYLAAHLKTIAGDKSIEKVLFRDPARGTKNYFFSVFSAKRCIYSKTVYSDDTYQQGYHKALIYRENCYNCAYACMDRVGDMTLGDFSGLGKIEPFLHEKSNVSCVLANTTRGLEMLKHMVNEGHIVAEKRPKEEAVMFERQLTAPSVPHPNRGVFLEMYRKSGDFDKAASFALCDDIAKYCHDKRTGKLFFKKIMLKIVTPKMRRKLKEMINK